MVQHARTTANPNPPTANVKGGSSNLRGLGAGSGMPFPRPNPQPPPPTKPTATSSSTTSTANATPTAPPPKQNQNTKILVPGIRDKAIDALNIAKDYKIIIGSNLHNNTYKNVGSIPLLKWRGISDKEIITRINNVYQVIKPNLKDAISNRVNININTTDNNKKTIDVKVINQSNNILNFFKQINDAVKLTKSNKAIITFDNLKSSLVTLVQKRNNFNNKNSINTMTFSQLLEVAKKPVGVKGGGTPQQPTPAPASTSTTASGNANANAKQQKNLEKRALALFNEFELKMRSRNKRTISNSNLSRILRGYGITTSMLNIGRLRRNNRGYYNVNDISRLLRTRGGRGSNIPLRSSIVVGGNTSRQSATTPYVYIPQQQQSSTPNSNGFRIGANITPSPSTPPPSTTQISAPVRKNNLGMGVTTPMRNNYSVPLTSEGSVPLPPKGTKKVYGIRKKLLKKTVSLVNKDKLRGLVKYVKMRNGLAVLDKGKKNIVKYIVRKIVKKKKKNSAQAPGNSGSNLSSNNNRSINGNRSSTQKNNRLYPSVNNNKGRNNGIIPKNFNNNTRMQSPNGIRYRNNQNQTGKA